jgi:hypothetical protein
VSFPCDLHSAVVFDSHIPCRSHAVPLPSHEYAFLKATSQGHGRVVAGSRQGRGRVAAWDQHGNGMVGVNKHRPPETAFWRPARFRLIPATTRSSRKFVIRSISISDVGGQCETKQRLSWTRRSLLVWCKDLSACTIYSTKIIITI